MLNNIIKILLISLVILLPLVNSHFFDLIGIKWGFYVNGNYEFTKVMFFNFFTGILGLLFFINHIKNKIIIPKINYIILISLIISTLFSNYLLTSSFGESSKGHGIIMFINLLIIFTILINQSKKDIKTVIKYLTIFSIFPILIGFKEYLFPTFNYGDLGNRAISTFGHPNYLALYCLIIIPFLIEGIKKFYNKILLVLITFLLFLTKSVWGIFIFILYFLYLIKNKFYKNLSRNKTILLSILFIFGLSVTIYDLGLFTKLNSFISRFYIWENTLNILFYDVKNILIGVGSDTLSYLFNNSKPQELYIFENIGYTADRPHNLLINYLYHFGIIGLSIFIYLLILFKKHIKNKPVYHSIILFLIFTLFNFPSIVHYIIITIFLAYIYLDSKEEIKVNKVKNIFFLPFIIILVISIISSFIYYSSEYKYYKTDSYKSINSIYYELIKEDPQIDSFLDQTSLESACSQLIKNINSAENNFYCGNIFWDIDKEIAINYYNDGLKLLPKMWDKNSEDFNNKILKYFYSEYRFFSPKYSNIEEILTRVNSKKID